VRLEQSLVLNRYFHWLLGARGLEDLKQMLVRVEEGPGADGQSRFFHAIAGLKGLRLPEEKLQEYDARVVGYEFRLAKARGGFVFKYFQYLSLLYTEVFLDRLTDDPTAFLRELNAFLDGLRNQEIGLSAFQAFEPGDLRRLAFFMATGSGKTLLLHVNLWQVLHYLKRGRHPEALVNRADRRRDFDTILLITPNEGLSRQHLEEFERSGIDATLLVEDRTGGGLLGPRVKVIEIHKLAEEPSREGVSILLEELGSANLVFVDEGHKGTGSEARTWKSRQRRLSADGFALEYSATFAQSIGAASPKVRDDLLAEYGKTILFDYSYRHFYDDGYGKDFRVLNLARAREARAHELLLGGLLTYYQQVRLYRVNEGEYRPYNLERPLWVFLGSSVNAVYSQDRQRRSDVATIVAFLRHFLDEPAWAVGTIRRILKGESGFTDQESREDLFARGLNHLKGMEAQDLYKQIAAEVFHGRGSLEVWELKGAEGELALRVSAPEGKENPYFGVINIGDVSAFKKYLAEHLKVEVREDRFTPSLFAEVNTQRSRVCVLIGAKKFIEGWSSWRVSTMGLLNMGKGEGPQVIQLFGRGVRLKGKRWTLKRSSMLPEEGPHPDGLSGLETLFIFGWNADYIQAFREMLEREEVVRELRVPTRTLFDPWPRLLIPRPQAGYRVESETWSLRAEPLHVSVDLTPQVTAMAGKAEAVGTVGQQRRVDFSQPMTAGLLDLDAMYAEVVEYKAARRYGNLFVPRDQLLPILKTSTLLMAEEDLREPELIQDGAVKILKTYLDRFVAVKEREAEARHLEPAPLPAVHESIVPYYTIRVSSEDLLRELESLVRKPTELYSDGGKPLPRLHVERHLFTPLLVDPADRGMTDISISPPGLAEGEENLVMSLRDFWKTHHKEEPYRHLEVFLLRNLPRVGVGFFRRSGFYPDFILWIKEKATKGIWIRFLEPHGMHHGGLSGNREKIEALKELEDLSKEAPFRAKKITMDGYIVTQSKREEIPGAEDKDWPTLERDYRVLQQDGEYFEKLLRAT
jgi:hypothetical protein